jgi:predicted phosphodiesterase
VRAALISDVHANAAALDAVLADAYARGFDQLWSLGDLVGYGPDPDAVADTLRAMDARCVRGNHDAAAIGELARDGFNPLAAAAVEWTADAISPATADYLRGHPLVSQDETTTLVHGTLREPLWEYLETYDEARAHFERQTTTFSMVGHTHRPVLIFCDQAGQISSQLTPQGEPYPLDRPGRWCINPGSVGQPRDGDPRASYAILDLAAPSVTYWRVAYDIAATQERMRARGLAEPHIARLALGR